VRHGYEAGEFYNSNCKFEKIRNDGASLQGIKIANPKNENSKASLGLLIPGMYEKFGI